MVNAFGVKPASSALAEISGFNASGDAQPCPHRQAEGIAHGSGALPLATPNKTEVL